MRCVRDGATRVSCLMWVVTIRERLEKITALVREKMEEAQKAHKAPYDSTLDRGASRRETVSRFYYQLRTTAQWQGPYKVVKAVGKVNYCVDMHDCRKRHRVFHVNML